ncbi:hypothetical protein EW146_g7780 [Bondarzewia mesenterica]|uniref:F-box domain-containing protein n=1 Tax=Bondarzewia mesenterica TaxID=1095465 RepID=A0A4V3XE42_9AGAM|nr:hypothetical protein EW146_g7780 [Bondarzewia mesenterica]
MVADSLARSDRSELTDGLSNPAEYWPTVAHPRLLAFDPTTILEVNDPQTADTIRSGIDHESYSIRTVLSTLNTRRNALLLICRLPSEVLAHVFEFCLTYEVPGARWMFRISGRARSTLGWIKVTHVCRKWRQVSLENPSLWRNITSHLGVAWMEEMLRRSKSSLINIREIYHLSTIMLESIPVSRHLSHLRTLCIHATPDDIQPFLKSLTSSAPFLENLELACVRNRQSNSRRRAVVILPTDIFSNSLPRLNNLTITGLCFPFSVTPLRSLVHLKVIFPDTGVLLPVPDAPAEATSELRLKLAQFLDTLKEMPELEVLELKDAVPVPPSTSLHLPSVTQIVPLTHLTLLALTGPALHCVNLIRSLRIPPTASICLNCTSLYPHGDDCIPLIPLLAPHAGGPKSGVSPLKTILASASDYVSLKGWNSIGDSHYRYYGPSPTIQLSITWSTPRSIRPVHMMDTICRGIYMEDVSVLIVYPSFKDPTIELWTHTFWRMRALQELHVSGDIAAEFIHALCMETAPMSDAKEAPRGPCFPKLRELRLVRVDFRHSILGSRDFHEALPDYLRIRQASSAPLQTLFIETCSIRAEWVDSLKGVIPDLIWDNETMEEYEQRDSDGDEFFD